MKQYLSLVALLLVLLALFGCGSIRCSTTLDHAPSELYSDREIDNAIHAAKRYFLFHFDGCTLLTIGYAADESKALADRIAVEHDAKQAIVLLSSFRTNASGGDGSLNPNATYTDWQWFLIQTPLGGWSVVDYGY